MHFCLVLLVPNVVVVVAEKLVLLGTTTTYYRRYLEALKLNNRSSVFLSYDACALNPGVTEF